jgi:hypothetical protein
MNNHSLKEGMTLVKPTKQQIEFIFTLAKERGITLYDSKFPDNTFTGLWFSGKTISSCMVDTKITQITFEQFITAMVTPESEPIPLNGKKIN